MGRFSRVPKRYDFLPFGEELGVGSGNPRQGVAGYPPGDVVLRIKFTGKERDAETGLDFFGVRYFSAAQGRWTSPDWSAGPQPVPYANFSDPQTLNLYGYVRNNTLGKADPDGHCPSCIIYIQESMPAIQRPDFDRLDGLRSAVRKLTRDCTCSLVHWHWNVS